MAIPTDEKLEELARAAYSLQATHLTADWDCLAHAAKRQWIEQERDKRDVDLVSTRTGAGKQEIMNAAKQLETEDLWYAAGYVVARGLAVNVRYSREEWNLRYAEDFAKRHQL